MERPRSLCKYFDDRRWAEAFLNGDMRFQTLAAFCHWEEQGVRGDRNEGTAFFAPDAGLEITNQTQGTRFRMPAHRLVSAVRHDEIFVFCLSRTWSRRLWDEFGAIACVEIFDIPAFCARVAAGLPEGARMGASRAVSGSVGAWSTTGPRMLTARAGRSRTRSRARSSMPTSGRTSSDWCSA